MAALGSVASPYAVSGVVGFGTGKSSAYVEGDLLLHITAFRNHKVAEVKKDVVKVSLVESELETE